VKYTGTFSHVIYLSASLQNGPGWFNELGSWIT
jgi:hypothetical protein